MGMKIKIARIRKNISQKELAKVVGISRITLSRIENGHINSVRSDIIEKLAAALETTPQELFFED